MPTSSERRSSVMIVDDDAPSLYATTRLLAAVGYETLPFASAIAARAHLEQHPVDVVVTDYWMREMNGAQLHASVRAALGDHTPPFVLITAMVAPIPPAQRQRFAGILEKPFAFGTLERLLVTAVFRHARPGPGRA